MKIFKKTKQVSTIIVIYKLENDHKYNSKQNSYLDQITARKGETFMQAKL